jgi:DnaJ-domain-containing protein 1
MLNIFYAFIIFVAGLVGSFPGAIAAFLVIRFIESQRRYYRIPENSRSSTDSQKFQDQTTRVPFDRTLRQRTLLYATLGTPVTATIPEVKTAYHRLALQNHPDKTRHLTPAQQRIAAARFQEVQEAYEEIRRQRGWKC